MSTSSISTDARYIIHRQEARGWLTGFSYREREDLFKELQTMAALGLELKVKETEMQEKSKSG